MYIYIELWNWTRVQYRLDWSFWADLKRIRVDEKMHRKLIIQKEVVFYVHRSRTTYDNQPACGPRHPWSLATQALILFTDVYVYFIYIYTCIHIYIYSNVCIICMHICMYVYVCIYVYECICMYMYVCMYVCIYIYVNICVYVCIYTYISYQ